MDFSCSLRHPDVVSPVIAKNPWILRKLRRGDSLSCRGSHKFFTISGCSKRTNNRVFLNSSLSCASCSGCLFGHSWHLNSSLRSLCGDRLSSFQLHCQANDSMPFVDGNVPNVELPTSPSEMNRSLLETTGKQNDILDPLSNFQTDDEQEVTTIDDLREMLQKAVKELEIARLNSTMFEEKAQKIAESAIALKDEASISWDRVTFAISSVQEITNEEDAAKEAVQKATMALSIAEARLQLATDSLATKNKQDVSSDASVEIDEQEELLAKEEIKSARACLENCEVDLKRVQEKKAELQKEVDRLNDIAQNIQLDALKAEEEVADIMLLAEQAVAFELEATQRVNDAEIALQKAEASSSNVNDLQKISSEEQNPGQVLPTYIEGDERISYEAAISEDIEGLPSADLTYSDVTVRGIEDVKVLDDVLEQDTVKMSSELLKEVEIEAEKRPIVIPTKKQERQQQKEFAKESSPSTPAPKALLNKSSRFFSASFFSSNVDGEEFTPTSVFSGLISTARKQAPKLVLGVFLLGLG